MLESRRVAAAALLLLPAGLVVYFAFNSGGFYPGPTAYVAVALCVVLALRVTLAANPLEGLGWPLALGAGALALYALLTLVSAGWSHAPGVALVNFGLPLVYLLALVLFGSVGHTHERLRWILRLLALGILVVCGCGLVTRLLPHVWPTAPDISNQRLSFPVSYWNVLGALAAVGIVLCVQLSSDLAEHRAIRVLAAAATPVLATTLYFTFSRGAIAVAIIAIVVYVLVGRPRGLLSAALAIVPATAIALKVAYDANVLATSNPNVPHGIVQGHHATAVLAACVVGAAAVRALALALDERLLRVSVPARLRSRGVGRAAWASLAVAVLVVAVAANGAIAHDWHRFVNPAEVGNGNDLRARLTDPGNNGRIDMWKVAWHGFKSAPVVGQGAGTFADTWAQHRPNANFVVDAHSLYMQTLDELGIVGLLLLIAVILIVLGRTAARIRGPSRPLYAATFAVLLALAIHTGVDWTGRCR
jgi:O-antigen ligase